MLRLHHTHVWTTTLPKEGFFRLKGNSYNVAVPGLHFWSSHRVSARPGVENAFLFFLRARHVQMRGWNLYLSSIATGAEHHSAGEWKTVQSTETWVSRERACRPQTAKKTRGHINCQLTLPKKTDSPKWGTRYIYPPPPPPIPMHKQRTLNSNVDNMFLKCNITWKSVHLLLFLSFLISAAEKIQTSAKRYLSMSAVMPLHRTLQ